MARFTTRWLIVLAIIPTGAVCAQDAETKLTTITARDIKLQVPAAWKPSRPTSNLRVAQLTIPNETADAESAELVVYYFGGPTGGIRANIDRWIGQFSQEGRNVSLLKGKCRDGSYFLADISGTWKKPVGPPIARKTIDKPDTRVIGVILVTKKEDERDYYFLKLSGPDALVRAQATALRGAFGADAESEAPFKLDDADN